MRSKLSENFGKWRPYLELFVGHRGRAEISLGGGPPAPHETAPARRQGGVMRSVLFVCHWFCHSVSRITLLRTHIVRIGKGWPHWSDEILVFIRIWLWIYDHFPTSINTTKTLTIYYHSPEGATSFLPDSAALAEFALSDHILFLT